MPIKFGNISIPSIYKGNTKIDSIYHGLNLVYRSSLLPSGYTECEYLESTGVQYIDTGYYSKSNSVYEMVVGDNSKVDTNAAGTIFGSSYGPALRYLTTGELRGGYNTGQWQSNSVTILDKNTIYMSNTTNTFNGNTLTLGTGTNTNYKIGIFANFSSQDGSTIGAYGKIKIFSFKIYTGSTLERDFIPCLDNTGTPCMYDTVSKTTFYNQGTGTFGFKIKAQIPETYTLCDYLESTGTQYIDTGIACNNAYLWQLDMEATDGLTQNTAVNGVIEEVDSNTYKRFHNVNNAQGQWKFYIGTGNAESTYITVGNNTREKILVDCRNNPRNVTIKTQVNDISMDLTNFPSHSFWLFGRWSNNAQYQFYAKEKLYGFSIIGANGVVMNLIPCLDENLKPCMYDSVSKQPFYNLGTGEFLYKTSNYKIPDNYTLCEYLASNGNQYIDTLYIPNTDTTVELEYMPTAYNGNRLNYIFGEYESNKACGLSRGQTAHSFVFGNIDVNVNNSPSTINNKYKIIVDKTGLTSNGTKYTYNSNNFTATKSIYLFYCNGTSQLGMIGNIYNSKIYENNVLLHYYIPCLDNNGVPCMYDLVGKQSYYNQGEGEFLYKVVDSTLLYQQTMLGFPASNSTQISIVTSYPYSYYFNDVTLELGKTYKMTFSHKRTPSGADDGTPRFRLINTDNTFYASITQYTYEDYWNVESITYDGNWYGCEEIIFSPKVKTHKLRLLIIVGTNQVCPPNFYLTSIEEVKD